MGNNDKIPEYMTLPEYWAMMQREEESGGGSSSGAELEETTETAVSPNLETRTPPRSGKRKTRKATKKAKEAARNSKNKRRGNRSEALAVSHLRSMGFLQVQQVATPIIIKETKQATGRRGGKGIRGLWVRFDYGERVNGDITAVTPDGRAVLCEVKNRPDRLQWSNIEPHQRDALDDYAEAGAVALVFWDSDYGSFLMRWPIPGFKPRTSIKPDRAAELDCSNIGAALL